MSREARIMALELSELFIAQRMKVEISLDRKLTQVTGIFESELWLDVEIHPAGDGELLFVLSTVGSQGGGPSRTEDIATFDELAHRIAEECRFRRGRVEAWDLASERDRTVIVEQEVMQADGTLMGMDLPGAFAVGDVVTMHNRAVRPQGSVSGSMVMSYVDPDALLRLAEAFRVPRRGEVDDE